MQLRLLMGTGSPFVHAFNVMCGMESSFAHAYYLTKWRTTYTQYNFQVEKMAFRRSEYF